MTLKEIYDFTPEQQQKIGLLLFNSFVKNLVDFVKWRDNHNAWMFKHEVFQRVEVYRLEENFYLFVRFINLESESRLQKHFTFGKDIEEFERLIDHDLRE